MLMSTFWKRTQLVFICHCFSVIILHAPIAESEAPVDSRVSELGSGWLRSVAEAIADLAAMIEVWHSAVQVITLLLLFVASAKGSRHFAIPGRNLWYKSIIPKNVVSLSSC